MFTKHAWQHSWGSSSINGQMFVYKSGGWYRPVSVSPGTGVYYTRLIIVSWWFPGSWEDFLDVSAIFSGHTRFYNIKNQERNRNTCVDSSLKIERGGLPVRKCVNCCQLYARGKRQKRTETLWCRLQIWGNMPREWERALWFFNSVINHFFFEVYINFWEVNA